MWGGTVPGEPSPKASQEAGARYGVATFGQEATSTSQDSERMKFTGQERDLRDPSNTTDDLNYMHARYDNPNLGRFLSTDPIRGNPKSPQSWNLYSYVRDNPVNAWDPLGLAAASFSTPITVTASDPETERERDAQRFMLYMILATLSHRATYAPRSQGRVWVVPCADWRTQIDSMDEPDLFLQTLSDLGDLEPFMVAGYYYLDLVTLPIGAVGGPVGTGIEEIGADAIAGRITGYAVTREGIRHGLMQAISPDELGVSARAILDAVRNPVRLLAQTEGRLRFEGSEAVVILNSGGEIITTWAKSSAGGRLIR
jgi:RHS repeat-associated protein